MASLLARACAGRKLFRSITLRHGATAGGDFGRTMSSSALFAKMLCLNGKNREGRSTLPRDPLPPPKRDGQAFAESSANVVDDAHRGQEYLPFVTITLYRRPIRIDCTWKSGSGQIKCGLCAQLQFALRGCTRPSHAFASCKCNQFKLRYSIARRKSLVRFETTQGADCRL